MRGFWEYLSVRSVIFRLGLIATLRWWMIDVLLFLEVSNRFNATMLEKIYHSPGKRDSYQSKTMNHVFSSSIQQIAYCFERVKWNMTCIVARSQLQAHVVHIACEGRETNFPDCMLLRMLLLAWHHRKMNQIERSCNETLLLGRLVRSPGNIVIHSAVMQTDKIWTRRKKWDVACSRWCRREGRCFRTLLVLFNHKYESWRLATSDWVTWRVPSASLSRESGWKNKLSHILP